MFCYIFLYHHKFDSFQSTRPELCKEENGWCANVKMGCVRKVKWAVCEKLSGVGTKSKVGVAKNKLGGVWKVKCARVKSKVDMQWSACAVLLALKMSASSSMRP